MTRRSFFGLIAAAFVAKPPVVDVFEASERAAWGFGTYIGNGTRQVVPMFVGEDAKPFPPLRVVITQRKLIARIVDLT